MGTSHNPAQPVQPLTDTEIDAVLADLDRFETPQQVLAKRMHVRVPYHTHVAVVCETGHDDREDAVRFTAVTHDLSDGRLGLIVSHASPPGTPCVVTLIGPDGVQYSVDGRVAQCKPHGGRAYLWDVAFAHTIDTSQFVNIRRVG